MNHDTLKLVMGFVLIASLLCAGAIAGFAPIGDSQRTAIIEVTEPLGVLTGAFAVWAFAKVKE